MTKNPTQRSLLVAGMPVDAVQARLRGFGDVFADISAGGHVWRFAVSKPFGDWIRIDVQPLLDPRHFHNLAVWFGLDDPPPRDLMAVSEGDGDWSYWLTRGADAAAPHVLAGATRSGRAFQVDCTSGARFDTPTARVPPLPTGLAMLNRGVHPLLQKPGHPLVEDACTVDIRLPAIHREPWSIPPSARLVDELDIKRTRAKGGAEILDAWLRGEG